MTALVTLLRAAPGVSPAALRDRLLSQETASHLLTLAPEFLAISLQTGAPEGVVLYGDASATERPHHALVEARVNNPADFIEALDALLRGTAEQGQSYTVETRTVFNHGEIRFGRPSSGFRLMRGLMFHEDLPISAIRRSWEAHESLAQKVHIGCCLYARHLVLDRLTPDGPPLGGFAELRFATKADLVERYFADERGRQEILQDITHFIRGGTDRIYAEEHILHGTP
jgi:hypothetical protein